MNKTAKIITGIIIVILVVWFGYSYYKKPAGDNEPIKIGVSMPLTGIAAIVGENEINGIKLAIDEINKDGGIYGRPVQLFIEDDQTEAKQTVSAVQKLISVDEADVLIGGAWDFLANAAIPIIDAQKKVMITPSTLPDTIEKNSNFFFATHSPVSLNESVITEFLRSVDGDNVAIMSVNNLWGKAHLDTFKKAIVGSGKSLIKEIIVPQFDNNDIQRELSLIKSLKPDVIITALNFGDSVMFVRKKFELGIGGDILGDFHVEDGYNQGNIKKEFLSGTKIFVFSDPSNDFINKYTKVYGKNPGTYADTAYDAVYVIKEAIENENGKTDSESIINGMRKINDYQGVSGKIDFSVNNYPANKMPIIKVFDGNKFIKYE